MSSNQPSNRKLLVWTTVICSVTLLVRLIFLWQAQEQLIFTIPLMDMEYHHQWGQALVAGNPFIDGPFFRAPLYPYFLGIVYYV